MRAKYYVKYFDTRKKEKQILFYTGCSLNIVAIFKKYDLCSPDDDAQYKVKLHFTSLHFVKLRQIQNCFYKSVRIFFKKTLKRKVVERILI